MNVLKNIYKYKIISYIYIKKEADKEMIKVKEYE